MREKSSQKCGDRRRKTEGPRGRKLPGMYVFLARLPPRTALTDTANIFRYTCHLDMSYGDYPLYRPISLTINQWQGVHTLQTGARTWCLLV